MVFMTVLEQLGVSFGGLKAREQELHGLTEMAENQEKIGTKPCNPAAMASIGHRWHGNDEWHQFHAINSGYRAGAMESAEYRMWCGWH